METLIRELRELVHELHRDLKALKSENSVRCHAELATKRDIERIERQIMTALENLTQSITELNTDDVALATAINAAIQQLGTPSATDAQINSLAALVQAQNDRIVALTAQLNAALSGGTATTPPVVTTHPTSQNVTVGGSASFISVATGSGTLTYQWLFNGAPIAGETNPNLTISNAQTANAGDYTVSVTNSAGTSTSAPATLTVA